MAQEGFMVDEYTVCHLRNSVAHFSVQDGKNANPRDLAENADHLTVGLRTWPGFAAGRAWLWQPASAFDEHA
jgi:hypothetical protein